MLTCMMVILAMVSIYFIGQRDGYSKNAEEDKAREREINS